MNNDRVEGVVRNFAGKAEDAVGGLTGDAKTQADGKIDKLAGTAQNTYGKAKDAAGDIAGQAQDAAAGIAANMSDTARKLGAQASDIGGKVYQQAADAGTYATQQMKEQPFVAMAAVGILGAILGYLLGRAATPEPSFRDYARRALPRDYR